MSDFTNSPGERWLSVSPRMTSMRMTEIGVLCLVVAVSTGVVAFLSEQAVLYVTLVVELGAGLIWMFLERRRIRSWAYCEREQELLVRRGLLFRRLSVVPYGRMQFIDVSAGPIERVFGLATVELHTAAAATDARIPGLEPEEAQRLRDQLTRLGEATLSGL